MGKSVRATKESEQKEIAKLRKQLGLPQIKTGTRECLRCGNDFFSEDLRNQYNCYLCRREDNISAPRIIERKVE